MAGPFEPGERALLIDGRGRRYMVSRLVPGESFHSHAGAVPHDLILGSVEGVRVHSTGGMGFVCFRPRLADFVLKMPRAAQVVYPKDLGAILVEADVFPGVRVLEAGTGSGALTIALTRAVGDRGTVVSYELRPEFHDRAAKNVETYFGVPPGWLDLRHGDLRDVAGHAERFDRVILDMPEPWHVLDAVVTVLEPGGVICTYVPTTIQVQTITLALQRHGFGQVQTFEVLRRNWYVTERSVRPDHRMVAHTGFITVARSGEPEPAEDDA